MHAQRMVILRPTRGAKGAEHHCPFYNGLNTDARVETIKAKGLNFQLYSNLLADMSDQSREGLVNLFKCMVTGAGKSKEGDGGRRSTSVGGDFEYTVYFNKWGPSKRRPQLRWDHAPAVLRQIVDDVGRLMGVDKGPFRQCYFDYVVIQSYSNGQAHIKPHKDQQAPDDEPIAGLTFGAPRTLQLRFSRHASKPIPPEFDVGGTREVRRTIGHGSLYVMWPPTNTHWTHGILPDRDVTTPRLSLTFRRMQWSDDGVIVPQPPPADYRPMQAGRRDRALRPGALTIPEGEPTCLRGMQFVITGRLPTLHREQAVEFIRMHGGIVNERNVTKATTHLLVGEVLDDGRGVETSGKYKDTVKANANGRGVRIWTEADLFLHVR